MSGDELTSIERTALAVWLLVNCEHGMTAREMSQHLGLGYGGSHYLLRAASRVVPLYQDGERWKLLR